MFSCYTITTNHKSTSVLNFGQELTMLLHLCCFDLNCPIGIILKITKWPYLSHLTSNKLSLFFGYEVKCLRYNHFVKFNWILPFGIFFKNNKMAISHSFSLKLSSTLTDEENKVHLFSWFEVKYQIYSNFVVLTQIRPYDILLKEQNGCISVIWPKNKKIRTLYCCQLSKLKEIKWPYFLDLRPNEWDISILLFLKLCPIGGCRSKQQNSYIFGIWPQIKKIRVLYFLKLSKFKKIVLLFSWFKDKLLIYGHFVVFKIKPYWWIQVKAAKFLYLWNMTSNQENKGILFSSTFIVEENKVPLFSWFEANWKI